MDLRQLRSLLAVIDHGSFSAAAEALFTVQSNVSGHVGRLEAEVGTTLLDRRSRELTPAGRVVERHSREILRQLEAITDGLAEIEDRIIGDVTCGTTPSVGLRVMPDLLARAASELPEVTVSVVAAHSGALLQQMAAGLLDLAITTFTPSTPDLRSTPLFSEAIVAVMSPFNPLAEINPDADTPGIALQDLAATKVLLPRQDNPIYRHIQAAFATAELRLTDVMEIGSSELVQALAAAELGVAIVPATAATDGIAANTIVREIHDMTPRQVGLSVRTSGSDMRAVEAIEEMVIESTRLAAATMPGCTVSDGSTGS